MSSVTKVNTESQLQNLHKAHENKSSENGSCPGILMSDPCNITGFYGSYRLDRTTLQKQTKNIIKSTNNTHTHTQIYNTLFV